MVVAVKGNFLERLVKGIQAEKLDAILRVKDRALKNQERLHQNKEGFHGYLKAILLHGAGRVRRPRVL